MNRLDGVDMYLENMNVKALKRPIRLGNLLPLEATVVAQTSNRVLLRQYFGCSANSETYCLFKQSLTLLPDAHCSVTNKVITIIILFDYNVH